ncbi:phosphoenolpyruvate--protein phosphotransferase [Candidatus Protochlamydia phocaeensis]|uniref:phosphoenolpyruvate--protein phosphotransferase n=1 Tax=Candidatus Protochlamydia phocaeensis TaxID=1414722 RepID=UPI000838CCF8|nr:phosphoenolpyruvate--protein phosphotransferase [Candidatus Protochlamydia phocaeensis]
MQIEMEEIVLKGYPICRGIAIGRPYFFKRDELVIAEMPIPPSHTEREIERYRMALSRSKQDLKRLQKQLESEAVLEGILILEAQLEMLQDPLLTKEIENNIRQSNKNVEFIFQQALLKYQERFQSLDDPFFAERFKDLQDVSRRIFSYLHESGNLSLQDIPPNSIVCAQELTASDVASAKIFSIGAFITSSGGSTSHAAIVAKAKGVPYITNVNLDSIKQNVDNIIIVDGRTGTITLNPTEGTIRQYEQLKRKMHGQFKDFEKVTKWPSQTFDGYSVRLLANLEMTQELDIVQELGGQGIGLFRSEYIFLLKNEVPSEEDQFKVYSHIVKKMKGMPVVIRTFDLGGDKSSLHYSFSGKNLFGGCRATRFLLQEQALFKSQLRAILRASIYGNVSILFPMVATLSELREIKRMLQEVREELQLFHPVRIGCMVEVPSAALIADHFAKECDFLSIGTNDLVQYSLAIDRSDQLLSEYYEPTDPSIVRLIKLITTEANKARIPVSVCGEIASDPRFIPLLLGLGVQELSVAPRYLPLIKNAIRSTSIVEAVHLAEKALELKTSQEVLELIVQEYQKNVPHDLFYNVC